MCVLIDTKNVVTRLAHRRVISFSLAASRHQLQQLCAGLWPAVRAAARCARRRTQREYCFAAAQPLSFPNSLAATCLYVRRKGRQWLPFLSLSPAHLAYASSHLSLAVTRAGMTATDRAFLTRGVVFAWSDDRQQRFSAGRR